MFNTDGEVVGILASGSNDICYAVSVNWVESSLKDTDEVKRAGVINMIEHVFLFYDDLDILVVLNTN